MSDFDLYYWPVPFRGQFIRGILAFAGKSWSEYDSDEIGELMARAPAEQTVPFMGPPVLIDKSNGFAIAEMPAIVLYLGEILDLLPSTPQGRAAALKVVTDANDVLDEITLDGGREMWTVEKWHDFAPRLKRWMEIWEATGQAHGLEEASGTLLGTHAPGVADIVTAILWSTMGERFETISSLLAGTAPRVAALVDRIRDMAPMIQLAEDSRRAYGNAYCGGEIEKSLRSVVS